MKCERVVGGQGLYAVAAQDFDDLGFGGGGGVDEECVAIAGAQRVGPDILDAQIEDAGLDGRGDVGFDALLEGGE